jgi:hypothetical protein
LSRKVLCSTLNKTAKYRQVLVELPETKHYENPFISSRDVTREQTGLVNPMDSFLLLFSEDSQIISCWITPERKRPPGRPRRAWGDNVKMDLRETGWGDMDWIHLAQDVDQ